MERSQIFSRPQVIENSRQYLLLRKDILQKTVVGCPCILGRKEEEIVTVFEISKKIAFIEMLIVSQNSFVENLF